MTYLTQEVYNCKHDFSIGARNTHFFSNKFQLLSELHNSQRKSGTDDTYGMTKFSLSPTLVPTGKQSACVRQQCALFFRWPITTKPKKTECTHPI
jgi:maltoporin